MQPLFCTFLAFLTFALKNTFFCESNFERMSYKSELNNDWRLGDVKCSLKANYYPKANFRLSNGDLFFLLEERKDHNVILVKLAAPEEGKWFRLYDGYPKNQSNWAPMFDWKGNSKQITATFVENDYLFIFYGTNELQLTRRNGLTDEFNLHKQLFTTDTIVRGWNFTTRTAGDSLYSVIFLKDEKENGFAYYYWHELKDRYFYETRQNYDFWKWSFEEIEYVNTRQQSVPFRYADFIFAQLTKLSYIAYESWFESDRLFIWAELKWDYGFLLPVLFVANDSFTIQRVTDVHNTYIASTENPPSEREPVKKYILIANNFSHNQEYRLFLPEKYLLGCPIDIFCFRFFIDGATKLDHKSLLIFAGRHVFHVKNMEQRLVTPVTIPEYFGTIELPFYIDASHTDSRTNITYVIKDNRIFTAKKQINAWFSISRGEKLYTFYPDLVEADASVFTDTQETFFFIGKEAGIRRYDVSNFPTKQNNAYRTGTKWISDVNPLLPTTIDASFRDPQDSRKIYYVKNNYLYFTEGTDVWHYNKKGLSFLGNYFGCKNAIRPKNGSVEFLTSKEFYESYYGMLKPFPSNNAGISTTPPPPYTMQTRGESSMMASPSTYRTSEKSDSSEKIEEILWTKENRNYSLIFILGILITIILISLIILIIIVLHYIPQKKRKQKVVYKVKPRKVDGRVEGNKHRRRSTDKRRRGDARRKR